MTKDEARLAVMGAISMALKGPTLQQGFEIICKNLSELEKENTELKDKLNNLASVAEVRLANWQKYEKENAELKKGLSVVNASNSFNKDQLTKAKELIEDMYDRILASHSDYYKDVMERAIDFLKGEKIEDEPKKKFVEWINENGGTDGVLYQTFSDDELEHIFMSAYEKNKR